MVLICAFGLVCLWALIAGGRWAMTFQDNVTLPNGMTLERSFDFTRHGRLDLMTSSGGQVLVAGVEFVCFDDRRVLAAPGGVFDADSGAKGLEDAAEDSLRSPLGCNGYYTSMISPELLFEGNKAPFLPLCDWQNLSNTSLKKRSWFDSPCEGDKGEKER